jgi:hypothetical protein
MVENANLNWLLEDKVKVTTFDFETKRFSTNHRKFSEVLDETTVTIPFSGASGTLQLSREAMVESATFTADPMHGTITASGSTTINAASSNFQLSTILPSFEQAALLDGVNATLAQLQSITIAKKKKLTATDISALFDPQYLHGGENAAIGAADLVTTLRNLKNVRNVAVSRLNSITPEINDKSQSDVDVV